MIQGTVDALLKSSHFSCIRAQCLRTQSLMIPTDPGTKPRLALLMRTHG
jgi:hypothetical protein